MGYTDEGRAWWYVFKICDQGRAVGMIAGPFKVRREALAARTKYQLVNWGVHYCVDSLHFNRKEV